MIIPRRLLLALLLATVADARLAADTGYEALVRTSAGEPVPDAVLSLTPLDGQPVPALPVPATPETPDAKISQSGQEYEPLVTPVRVGATVEFPNLDNVQHHVYSLSKPKRFEIPLYDAGRSETVVFDRPGVVTLGCNIHDWMVAYVVILETPWFAKTTAEGRASLTSLPPGRYRLDLWHPRLAKPLVQEITLPPAALSTAPAEFTLTLRPERKIRRAPAADPGARY